MDNVSLSHTRWNCQCHIVFVPKYRRKRVVTDITQFRYRNTNYHFVCFLDLFNNEILEWNVSKTETMDLILPPLRRLLK